jgi:hypothetical protein
MEIDENKKLQLKSLCLSSMFSPKIRTQVSMGQQWREGEQQALIPHNQPEMQT